MVKIDKNNITMTRGDTMRVKINIFDASCDPYTPQKGDTIRFALKQKYTDEEPLIVKDIPYDTCVLELLPEDTKELAMPEIYVYDIQITLKDGTVDTFLSGKLKTKEEVY